MLVHHCCFQTGDLDSLSQVIQNEILEMSSTRNSYMNQYVFVTGDDIDGECFFESEYEVAERLDCLTRLRPKYDGNHCFDFSIETRQIYFGVKTGDDSGVPQRPCSFEASRRRNSELLGQVAIGDPGICLQCGHYRRIKFVQDRAFQVATELSSAVGASVATIGTLFTETPNE